LICLREMGGFLGLLFVVGMFGVIVVIWVFKEEIQ
jgi:hypothetical protein